MSIISRSVNVCLNGCGFTETVHRLWFRVVVTGYGYGLRVRVAGTGYGSRTAC